MARIPIIAEEVNMNAGSQLPPILYKYRFWNDDNHKRLLKDNEIFLSSPALFKDPKDSKIPIHFDNGTEEKAFKIALSEIEHDHPCWNTKAQREHAKHLVSLSNWKDPKNLDRLYKFQRDKFNGAFGICSLSERKNLDQVWRVYGDQHKGFCVGFNVKKLMHFLKNVIFTRRGDPIILLEKVTYEDQDPYIDGWDNSDEAIVKVLRTKIKDDYAFEEEQRLILINGTNRQIKLRDDIIEEVIIGCKIDDPNMVQEIIDILRKKSTKGRLYKARQSSNGLQFDEIIY